MPRLETIEVVRLRVFFQHNLRAHAPLGKISFLDGVEEIALRVVQIGAFQRARLLAIGAMVVFAR